MPAVMFLSHAPSENSVEIFEKATRAQMISHTDATELGALLLGQLEAVFSCALKNS
ncbi:MAG: hypothetical protein ACD_28C00133G0003 [uncultured bacterium]|nr:MAG: hypothetical protein ACD_28C00133G0003 [uncultured bacterium]